MDQRVAQGRQRGGGTGGGSQDRAPASGLSVLKGQVELTRGCEVSCPLKCDRSQPPRTLLQAPSGGRGRRVGGQLPLAPPPLWAGPTQRPQAMVGHSNVRLSLRESPWSECVQTE